jgi:hypothetical protein
VTDFTKGSINGLSGPLTSALKEAALAAGWDSMLVAQLSVVADDTGINIEYPEGIADKIEDLEYGTIDHPPASVFRTFLTKNSTIVENSVSASVIDNLFDSGVLP